MGTEEIDAVAAEDDKSSRKTWTGKAPRFFRKLLNCLINEKRYFIGHDEALLRARTPQARQAPFDIWE